MIRSAPIRLGMLADLIAINGRSDDPYEQLLLARETSVTLVIIEGVPVDTVIEWRRNAV